MTTHGHCTGYSISKEYKAWTSMLQRCRSIKTPIFENYFCRGISVCDEWSNSFMQFIDDMGHAPTKQHTLERKDNNKGYSPGNCKWATRTEQCRNSRRNSWFYLNGKRTIQQDISDYFGVSSAYISKLKQLGYSKDEIITKLKSRQTKPLKYRRLGK